MQCRRVKNPESLTSSDFLVRRLTVGRSFVFVNRGRVILKGFQERVHLYEVRRADAHERAGNSRSEYWVQSTT
jgi:class 3 adenylate cyclase